MKHLIIVAILLCSFLSIYSQGVVKAVVMDNYGSPIPYATVYNSNTHRGVITNEEGRFGMDGQSDDSIIIRCLGYHEYKSTVDQLQNDTIINLKEAIYNINELTVTPNDAKNIVRKFITRIRRNYPKRATIFSGVYKEYSLMENEYYGLLRYDVDILVDHVTSLSCPVYQTKVYDYKEFRHSSIKALLEIDAKCYYYLFWLLGHTFLWDFQKFQYRHLGHIIYNGSKLMKIEFHPEHMDKSVKQYEGIMYIDMKTYALVFLQYAMLPNEMDFYLYEGRWQKPIKEETKIMFEFYKRRYYPAYIISNIRMMGVGTEWEIKPDHKDTIIMNHVFNFFTKNIKTRTKGFIADCRFLDELNQKKGKTNIFDQSKDYKGDFILETEKEKQFIELYEK
jgi:hypothetical protein